jgi:hypothetical protein
MFITLFRRSISNNFPGKKIQNLFVQYDVNPTEFSINFNILDNLISRNDYLFNILQKIVKFYFGPGKEFDFDIYWYITSDKKNEVLIFDCSTELQIGTGKVFGDMALDNQSNIR